MCEAHQLHPQRGKGAVSVTAYFGCHSDSIARRCRSRDIYYLWSQHPQPGAFASSMLASPPFPWESETYLKPIVDGDALLQYDFDGDDGNDEQAATSHSMKKQ